MQSKTKQQLLDNHGYTLLGIRCYEAWVVVTFQKEASYSVWLMDIDDNRLGAVRLRISIESNAPITTQISNELLVVWSLDGGKAVVDLSSGNIIPMK